MQERKYVRRALLPAAGIATALVAITLGFVGLAPAAADGEDLFEGRRYALSEPPAEFELPATASAATIFDEDDRIEVEDTTEWPYRLVVHLVMFDIFEEPVGQCSGILLNVDVVLTAAHCLWDDTFDEPFGSILVIPGEDGFGTEPFGTAGAPGDWISIPVGYTDTDGPEFDFGLLHLAGWDYDGTIGPFPSIATASEDFFDHPGTFLVMAGYPGDKPLGTQWVVAAPVYHVEDTLIYSRIDSYFGQSGSGMFGVNPDLDTTSVVGVFTSASMEMGRGVRLSPLHVDALHNYCEDAGCTFSSTHLEAPSAPAPSPSPSPTARPSPSPSPTNTPNPALTHRSTLALVGRD